MDSSSHILHATDANFESEILTSERPAIVDFWATWSGPCRAMAPVVEELSRKYGEQIKIAKLNIDDSPQTPCNYGIMTFPAFLLFKDGEVVDQLQGAVAKNVLEEFFQRALA